MTANQIRATELSPVDGEAIVDASFFLREIAAQLAEQNEHLKIIAAAFDDGRLTAYVNQG